MVELEFLLIPKLDDEHSMTTFGMSVNKTIARRNIDSQTMKKNKNCNEFFSLSVSAKNPTTNDLAQNYAARPTFEESDTPHRVTDCVQWVYSFIGSTCYQFGI